MVLVCFKSYKESFSDIRYLIMSWLITALDDTGQRHKSERKTFRRHVAISSANRHDKKEERRVSAEVAINSVLTVEF